MSDADTTTTTRPRRATPAAGFLLVGTAFAVAMAFSTVPAPLYVLYQQRDGFSTFAVTVVFAVYAVGVIAALLLIGHVSDWLGRRPMVLAALGVEVVAAVLFLTTSGLAWLIAARFVTGLGVGMLTATATAHMGELYARARPAAPRAGAERGAIVANMGGLSLGPLIAGALAQWLPNPLALVYQVFVIALVVAVVAVLLAPETVARPDPLPRYRPQRVVVPAADRPLFLTVCLASLAGFGVLGMFTSVAPGFVGGVLGEPSRFVAGLVPFLVFAAGALGQILVSAWRPRRQLLVGIALLVVGVAVVTAAVWHPALIPFVAGGVLAGAGNGVLFKGALSTVVSIAPPHARGEAIAGLFVAAYLGLIIPVVGLGLATQAFATATALTGFALAVVLAVGVAALRLTRGRAAA